jgi:hypothetical protein
MNIMTNAIKAIAGEGRVRIITEFRGDSVVIEIGDRGEGMTPDVRARIFEPFFTTCDVGEGRGLGLSIAWGIIEKHGGAIEVSSTPGEGSTFRISLPGQHHLPVKSGIQSEDERCGSAAMLSLILYSSFLLPHRQCQHSRYIGSEDIPEHVDRPRLPCDVAGLPDEQTIVERLLGDIECAVLVDPYPSAGIGRALVSVG